MKSSHKFGFAAVAAVAALGFAVPVHAGQETSIDPDFTCDDGSNIELDIRAGDEDEFSVFIDDMENPVDENVSPDVLSYEVDGDGWYHVVVVDETTDQTVFDRLVGVACDGPLVLTDTSCEDDGGHLWINIADGASYDYDISVDGTPATGWISGDSDTDQDYFDLGVYPEGTHTVMVVGTEKGDALDGFPKTLTVVIDCVEDDSGAGIPTVGSTSTPLLAIAGLLMAGGIGLLAARRLRTA